MSKKNSKNILIEKEKLKIINAFLHSFDAVIQLAKLLNHPDFNLRFHKPHKTFLSIHFHMSSHSFLTCWLLLSNKLCFLIL